MKKNRPWAALFLGWTGDAARSFFLRPAVWFAAVFFFFFPLQGQRDISTRIVGPGTQLREIKDKSANLQVYVLKVDLTHPSVRIETALAFDRLPQSETVLDICRRYDHSDRSVIGAVNGDYFVSSYPSGLTVSRGRLVRMPQGWSGIAFAADNTPLIARFRQQIVFSTQAGKRIVMNGLNRRRRDADMILYTDAYGEHTVSSSEGKEFLLDPKGFILSTSSRFLVNVVGPADLPIENHIPRGKWVLSFGKLSSQIPESLKAGAVWRLESRIQPPFPGLFNALSGGPRILREGRISVEWKREGQREGFEKEKHPRTAVGYSRDRKYLVLLVVDGRRAGSRGADLYETAEMMLEWGCYDAVNLDGGGSSTMVVRNRVVNRPSDLGGPRKVANALLVLEMIPERGAESRVSNFFYD